MIRSIRWRLQLWYAAVLLAVVAGFGGILFYRAREARWRQVDTQLEAAAVSLDANLRGFPFPELDGHPPDQPPFPPPPPRGPGGNGPARQPDHPPPPPPGRPRERELTLPPVEGPE